MQEKKASRGQRAGRKQGEGRNQEETQMSLNSGQARHAWGSFAGELAVGRGSNRLMVAT